MGQIVYGHQPEDHLVNVRRKAQKPMVVVRHGSQDGLARALVGYGRKIVDQCSLFGTRFGGRRDPPILW